MTKYGRRIRKYIYQSEMIVSRTLANEFYVVYTPDSTMFRSFSLELVSVRNPPQGTKEHIDG